MQVASFDQHAHQYDVEFTNSIVGLAQRNQVYKHVLNLLNRNTKVLELNAGTGYDAIYFSGLVKSIVATDASSEMIQTIDAKIKTSNIKNIQTKQLAFNELDLLLPNQFNFVFSNFGGLNCLMADEWPKFKSNLIELTEKHSKLVLVIMGKRCIWHGLLRSLHPKFKHLQSRNTNEAIDLNLSGSSAKVRFYSPKEVKSLMGSRFKLMDVKPIGFFVPPSYTSNFFSRHPFWFSILKKLDNTVSNFSFLSNYSDHYLIEFERE